MGKEAGCEKKKCGNTGSSKEIEGGECKVMRVGVEGIWYNGEGEGIGSRQRYEGGRWRIVILSPGAEDKLLEARAAQVNKAALVSHVKREYLRHRKWYRIAFLQVTNDKKHDCWSPQAFASHRLEFYDIFHKNGAV